MRPTLVAVARTWDIECCLSSWVIVGGRVEGDATSKLKVFGFSAVLQFIASTVLLQPFFGTVRLLRDRLLTPPRCVGHLIRFSRRGYCFWALNLGAVFGIFKAIFNMTACPW